MIEKLALAVGLAAAISLTAELDSASAATFAVPICADAPNGETTAISPTNTSPGTLSTVSTCPPTPSSTFSGLLVSTTLMAANSPTGATAAWSIVAAPGTTLSALSVRRYFGKRDTFWNVTVRKTGGQVLETCEFDPSTQLECTVGSSTPTDAENYVTYTNLATQGVSFSLVCQAGMFTCLSGATQRQAWIALYGATAVVDDPAPPQVSTLQGSLVSASTHGWHRGQQQATFDAADASGLRSATLIVDDAPVATSAQSCDFTRMQPCPGTVHAAFDIDLAQLADGTHLVRGQAVDAADQPQLTTPVALQVDNHAPAAPVNLTATRNADGSFAASWTNPGQGAGAPIAVAYYEVCDPAGTTCGPVNSAAAPNIAQIAELAVPDTPGDYLLRLWLEDDAGNATPASAASVVVHQPRRDPVRVGAHLGFRVALQRSSFLTVAGSIAPNARGTVSAVLRHARTRTTTHTRPSHGSWKLRLRLPPTIKTKMRFALMVTYTGDQLHRPAKASRTLIARRSWTPQKPSRRFRITTI